MPHSSITYHTILATYFSVQPLFIDGVKQEMPHIRMCTELPWQQIKADMFQEVIKTLENIFFLEAKVIGGMTFKLTEDFSYAIDILPNDDPEYQVLILLKEAIQLEIHFIARHAMDYPQALFQCLWNTCWWIDSPTAKKHYRDSILDKTKSKSNRTHLKITSILDKWLLEKSKLKPRFLWLKSLRPLAQATDNAIIASIQGFGDLATNISIRQDVKYIAGGFGIHGWKEKGFAAVWDLKTLELIYSKEYPSVVVNISYSPNHQYLAVGLTNDEVYIYDAVRLNLIYKLQGTYIAWSKDSKLMATASAEDKITIWEINTWHKLHNIQLPFSGKVAWLAFSPTEDILAIGMKGGHYPISCFNYCTSELSTVNYNDRANQIISNAGCDCTGVSSIAFSPDGKKIAATCETYVFRDLKNSVLIFDVKSLMHLKTLHGHNNLGICVCFSQDGNYIASGSKDGSVKEWEIVSGKLTAILEGHNDFVNTVSYLHGAERIIFSGGGDSRLIQWNPSRYKDIRLKGHEDYINHVTASTNCCASVADDNAVCLWDSNTGLLLKTLANADEPLYRVKFSSDEQTIIACNRRRHLLGGGHVGLQSGNIIPEKGNRLYKWDTNSGRFLGCEDSVSNRKESFFDGNSIKIPTSNKIYNEFSCDQLTLVKKPHELVILDMNNNIIGGFPGRFESIDIDNNTIIAASGKHITLIQIEISTN